MSAASDNRRALGGAALFGSLIGVVVGAIVGVAAGAAAGGKGRRGHGAAVGAGVGALVAGGIGGLAFPTALYLGSPLEPRLTEPPAPAPANGLARGRA